MGALGSRQAIVAAVAVALLLRLGFGFFYWTGKPLTHDEREYLSLAESLASGSGFTYAEPPDSGSGQRFARAPGYPAFLSLLRANASTGAAPGTVKLVQSLLGAVVVFMIAILGWRAAGPRAGVVAGALAAVYPPLVWLSGYVLSESLYMPLALGCVLLLDQAVRRADQGHSPRAGGALSVAAGAVAGVSILVRPGMLIFLPFAAVWLMSRKQLTLALALLVTAFLVVAPWTLRNLHTHGRFVLVASEGGVTFWTGNHALARGEGDLAANPDIKRAEIAFRAAHPGLTAEAMEPLYYQDAMRQIVAHPGWWLGLLARKGFYSVVPIGPSYTLHSTRYLVTTVVPYALLLPLAVAGFIIISRHGRPPVPLYLLGASVLLTCLMFFPQERFRIPVIDPLVIVGAAAAIGIGPKR
jgi:4-amino-4-deoxy-L-arabinose transferase-like glycosyltransferase